MQDVQLDELQQLVLFYKQKASDLELELLKMQIKLNKVIAATPVDQKKSK